MKERLKKYNNRIRMLPKLAQNAKKKIPAIRALPVPLLRFNFGVMASVLQDGWRGLSRGI
jgi:hypothetical protein